MACKTESKKIGDHEYSVTQWPVEKSLLMKFKILKVIGPSIGALKSSKKGEELEAFSEALTSIFTNSDPEYMVKLMKDSVVGVSCDDAKITNTTFTEIFSGDLGDLYKVFIFVITVNYSDFFKGQWAKTLLAKVDTSQ